MKDNKKYIDKVIGSLVRGTKIDYEKKLLLFRFYNTHSSPSFPTLFFIDSLNYVSLPPPFFSSYCKNTFGLTKEEINYVFRQWRGIMKDKIKQ